MLFHFLLLKLIITKRAIKLMQTNNIYKQENNMENVHLKKLNSSCFFCYDLFFDLYLQTSGFNIQFFRFGMGFKSDFLALHT